MKIIQVIPSFDMGGAETMCETLIYELIELGHEVIAVSLYEKETVITQRLKNSRVDLRFLGKKDGFDFSIYKKLRALFKQEKPDVIHTHTYATKYVFPVAARLKIRVIHTIHSVATREATKMTRKFNGMFFRHFNIVPVALSTNIQKTIIDEYKLDAKNVPIVLNGVDLKKCRVKENYEVNGTFKIVHVGSFLEVKNHIGMLEAFQMFHEQYPTSELHFIGDGIRRPLIEDMARVKNLSDCVVFHGLQSNVHLFLSDMDVFTLPSLYEGIPMSIAEAMGTGLPIIATNIGGIPDMLDEDSALLIPPDVVAIYQAYEKYYLDAKLRKKHGGNAFKAVEKFSSKVMANDYIQIYSAKGRNAQS